MKKYWILSNAILVLLEVILLIAVYTRWTTPTISIVLPTYNRADFYLPRAIDSILNQTFRDFELVIIDDASSDNTEAVVRTYMEKDKRIRYFKNAKNRGVSYSRNRGNDMARGTYITVMDSDDIAYKYWLEKTYRFAEQHPDKDIFVPTRQIYVEKELKQEPRGKMLWQYPLARMIFSSSIGNIGVTFRRDFIRKHRIRYDERISNGEDWDFWLKMGYAGGSIIRVPAGPLLIARYHWRNPREYYQRIGVDSRAVFNRLLNFLRVPTEHRNDKCFVLKAARQKMPTYIPQKDWENGIKQYCNDHEKPLVSIIMSTYNRANMLPTAIDSILEQSYPDFEFIIVNDGSTDETDTVLKEYAAADNRIVVLTNPENKGLVFGLNRGLDIAKGKYIARMDDDDYSIPNRLEVQVNFMEKHPEIAVLGSERPDFYADFSDKVQIELIAQKATEPFEPSKEDLSDVAITSYFNVPIFHPSAMIRASFINTYKIRYSNDFPSAEDTPFWHEIILKGGKIARMETPLVLRGKSPKKEGYSKQQLDSFHRFLDKSLADILPPGSIKGWVYRKQICQILTAMKPFAGKRPMLTTEGIDRLIKENDCSSHK